MSFGPTNTPAFHTAVMKDLKDKWYKLFIIQLLKLSTHGGKSITLVAADEIKIGCKPVIWGSKVIIDDILLGCDIKEYTLILFKCVCEVFKKYRVSFCLEKCEFLRPRVEYVGQDILCRGNYPNQSKFNMIDDWPLPTLGQSLFSFICLVNFYSRYAPYMKIRLKPLRKMVKKFYRNPIPALAWLAELSSLFTDFKKSITSSPVLARFDPLKLTFLKTNWSIEGMVWTLMQPADNEESSREATTLKEASKCLFSLTKMALD